MSSIVVAFFTAVLFGIGLGVSGMTLPAKVIGFLDITGNWDPSLAFVMIGAIAVHALSYRWITRRSSPLLSAKFQIPTRRDIDWKLVVGAAIFGLGWGLGGLCPGPSIVASASGHVSVLTFVASMVAGVFLHKVFTTHLFKD
jgi:uncharacterized membrane protein YedE/YeeE